MYSGPMLFLFYLLTECSTIVLCRPNIDSLLLRRITRSQLTDQSNKDESVRIESLHVESRVTYRYAHTLVTSRVVNSANFSQQIKFSVLLPESSFITGFSLQVGGKVYKSFVKEKQKAKHQYQQAVDGGLTAGHLAVSARDSNHFYVSVNVEARGRASFNLTYEQLLTRKLGLYNLVVNLHPGQVVPDLSVIVEVSEPQLLTKLVVTPFNTGSQISTNIENEVWNGVTVERPSKQRAVVRFTPSAEMQSDLSVADGEGLSGQLIIKYDVENQLPGGTILVNDGYFVHIVAPSDLPALRKHAIFTLDVSGSMTGRKLQQLKEAMIRILDDLDPSDYFNIIEFSYSVTVWNLDSLSSSTVFQPELHSSGLWWFNRAELPATSPPSTTPEPPAHAVPPYPASPHYIRKAKDVIEKMTAGGGTNIHGALKTAVLAASASFKNSSINTMSPQPEPIIIFLTDGDPTIGITDSNQILSMVKELNVKQSAIFSLAFGDGADLSFLRRLSLANNGFARNIYEAADAELQLCNFYREVASPLLSNITFSYVPGQVLRSSVTSQNFHTLFLGSQLVVAGRLDKTKQVAGTVTGLTAHGKTTYHAQSSPILIDELPADFYGVVSSEEDSSEGESKERKRKRKKKGKGALEHLWAYLTVQQLLEQRQVSDSEDTKKKVLELALKYNFVTPITSLVVIKPNHSVEIDQDSLKPQPIKNRLYAGNLLPHLQKSRPTPTRIHLEGTSSFMEDSSTNKVYTMERLKNLTLDDIRWIEGLVDKENATITLPLGVNGTNQQYRLGLNQVDWPLGDCSSPQNQPSQCRHLPHCVLPQILHSVTNYIRYYCPLPNGFAGICCPDSRYIPSTTTDRIETTTTGDTIDDMNTTPTAATTTESLDTTTQV